MNAIVWEGGLDPQSGEGDTAVSQIQHASIDIKGICVFPFQLNVPIGNDILSGKRI